MRGGWAALVAALLGLQAAPALAERDPNSGAPLPPSHKKKATPSPITDRAYVEGIFYPFAISTGLRLDASATQPGTQVSAERDLGLLSRQYQGRVEAMVRMRERSKVVMDFEDVTRSASQILSQDIQLRDVTFLKGQQANTFLSWRQATLTYTYSLYRTDEFEVGTGVALHMLQVQGRTDVPTLDQHVQASTAQFFPAVPVDFTWRFDRRFAFTGRAQYLKASINSFDGSLLDLHGDVQYRWNPNFAVGVGYTLERVAAQLGGGNFPGIFSIDMRGPEAFFRVAL
jgi:hypothetical protein